jgi:hypothetical protein
MNPPSPLNSPSSGFPRFFPTYTTFPSSPISIPEIKSGSYKEKMNTGLVFIAKQCNIMDKERKFTFVHIAKTQSNFYVEVYNGDIP